jgi:enolase-phosphatase E1
VSPAETLEVRVILLDIEGTTTPAEFVYHTLFPFAERKLESFLREHARDPEIQRLIAELRVQHERDARSGFEPPRWADESEEARLRSSIAYGQWLIVKDSKRTTLKSLQGKIWQQGYASGELRGQVFPDVPAALKRWWRQKKIICIYSSGSVLAQQNLFRTTARGDLTPLISLYFDTRVGPKTERDSYQRIAASFAQRPERFLFISDAVKEIEAAQMAGMQALLCVRGERSPAASVTARVIHDFNAVLPD